MNLNQGNLDATVNKIVALGNVGIPSDPSIDGIQDINRCLSKIISNRQALAEYSSLVLVREGNLAVEEESLSTEYKIHLDELQLSDDKVKSGRNKEIRAARAKTDPRSAELRNKIIEVKKQRSVYKSLQKVIDMTEANLKIAKESIGRMIAIIEVEFQNR